MWLRCDWIGPIRCSLTYCLSLRLQPYIYNHYSSFSIDRKSITSDAIPTEPDGPNQPENVLPWFSSVGIGRLPWWSSAGICSDFPGIRFPTASRFSSNQIPNRDFPLRALLLPWFSSARSALAPPLISAAGVLSPCHGWQAGKGR
jgi:hypothetical protein